jgi:m7GpppX diphosphatase
MVTETPTIYRDHVQPYMKAKREEGRLNWVFNILEGRTEQEDVIMRDEGHGPEDAFLMLPDLNWDRKTMGSLHLLALVHRRDIWSLRDLKKSYVPWLKYLRKRVLEATVSMYPDLEEDQLKLYVHCEFWVFMVGISCWIALLTGYIQINRLITISIFML